jgi:putative ABC transport system permease protein
VAVSPDFFRVLGTTIVQGRQFQPGDNEHSAGVAIVNRSFARQFCPDGALGKRFHSIVAEHCAGCLPGAPAELEIVGIATDVHQQGLDRPTEPQIYVPFAQAPQPGFHAVLATNGNPGVLAAPLRSTVFALNHQAPVFDIATLDQRLSESLAQRRLTMFLLSAFAVLALMLAAIGVYGVISYTVVRRTQEIGIRVALGATREGVMRLILTELARTILLGSATGLALAFALSGVLSSLLYGVEPRDFTAFALSWILLTAVAFLAGAAPAWRAMRADPCTALRCE